MTDREFVIQNGGIYNQSPQILIRSFKDVDFEGLYLLEKEQGIIDLRDSETQEDFEWWLRYTKPQYESEKKSYLNLAIVDPITDSFMGELTLQDYRSQTPEFGIDLLEAYQGKGIAANTLKLYMEKCVQIREIKYFTARIKEDNIYSQKMISKLNSKMVLQIGYKYCYKIWA